MLKRSGPNTEPWGTSTCMGRVFEMISSILTENILWVKYCLMSVVNGAASPSEWNSLERWFSVVSRLEVTHPSFQILDPPLTRQARCSAISSGGPRRVTVAEGTSRRYWGRNPETPTRGGPNVPPLGRRIGWLFG
ncbi:hypothetical protein Trydic_g22901 [Trypoxylus dichotomus]